MNLSCLFNPPPTVSMTSPLPSPTSSSSVGRCTLPDITEEGQIKRWCKECNAYLDISKFPKRSRRYMMCNEHMVSKSRILKTQTAYKVMRDTSFFCKTTEHYYETCPTGTNFLVVLLWATTGMSDSVCTRNFVPVGHVS